MTGRGVLIVYGSVHGQVEKVARRLAEILETYGHPVTLLDGERLPPGLEVAKYDLVVVGGSVHFGRHERYLEDFVADNRDALRATAGAFFSVSGSAAGPDDRQLERGRSYLQDFLERTGWRPEQTATFGGAIRYTMYGFFTRWLMRLISKNEGRSTDTSRDHEYTDWERVRGFAETLAEAAEGGQRPTSGGI